MALRLRTLVSVAALSAIALAANSQRINTSAKPCRSGPAGGVWMLPEPDQDGSVDGVLSLGPTGVVAYYFTATLTDVSSPCLSCIEGKLDGYLDDGIGIGPDYEVHGSYLGGWVSGAGHFDARISKPIGPALVKVGRLAGTFNDPAYSSTGPGTFQGQWRICD